MIHYLRLDGVKVLVVDDSKANLLVARGLLAPYGLKADTASSGREAVEMVQRKNYDMIFMDHIMPEMDGVETVKIIREWEKEIEQSELQSELPKRIPIVAMTANALRGDFYLENGFDDFLSKPVNPPALDETLKKWLQKSLFSQPQSAITIPNLFIPLVEEQHLDILNHYRETFVTTHRGSTEPRFPSASGYASSGLAPDTEYFIKFTAFIKSLNIEDAGLREQALVLEKAGQQEDPHTIRELLPVFCKDMLHLSELRKQQKQSDEGENGDDQKILSKLLQRLENALVNNEWETADAVMKELAAEDLTDKCRDMYFRLNDLMFEGDAEKILELIRGENHD
jgi:CheY-like chemotaxis protein